jgi:hypothetical protein
MILPKSGNPGNFLFFATTKSGERLYFGGRFGRRQQSCGYLSVSDSMNPIVGGGTKASIRSLPSRCRSYLEVGAHGEVPSWLRSIASPAGLGDLDLD